MGIVIAHGSAPWGCCDGPSDYQHRIYSASNADENLTTICDVVETRDARLICAAPELLAALEAYEEEMRFVLESGVWDWVRLRQAHALATTAINRARKGS